MRVLVLEASTTSAKAMYYDTSDNSFTVKTQPYLNEYSDISIHDPENVFRQLIEVGRKTAAHRPVDIISLCETWHSLLLCDRKMIPVSPVYSWEYAGASELCRKLRKENQEYTDRYYHTTGCMVNGIYPFFKLKMLHEKGVDLSRTIAMNQGTYNTFRLTGNAAANNSIYSGCGLIDVRTGSYTELIKDMGMTEENLPVLGSYRTTYPLTSEMADALDIKAGIPVIPANADGALNQIGSGAMGNGIMTLSVGTSGAMRLTSSEAIIPRKPSLWCYRLPDAWATGAATNGCCNCIDWFKKKYYPAGVSYREIEQQIRDFDHPPVFLPFLYGERCPGWDDTRKGAFYDVRAQHTLADKYLAIQEGVLFHLYQCYEILTQLNGDPRRIRLSGGILHSAMWTQMCADIFGKEMETDMSEHASMMGAVAVAEEITGMIRSLEEYRNETKEIIRPDMEKREKYMQRYSRYLECYQGCESGETVSP